MINVVMVALLLMAFLLIATGIGSDQLDARKLHFDAALLLYLVLLAMCIVGKLVQ